MKGIFIAMAILSGLFFVEINPVFADDRPIFIGDEIVLEIQDTALSEADIKDAFEAFRLVDISFIDKGYQVTVSPTKTGEQEVYLNNRKIVIDVKSTLDEIDRDSIFEKELDLGHYISRNTVLILLGVSSIVAIISNTIWGFAYFGKKKKEPLSPYQRFVLSMNKDKKMNKNDLGYMTKNSKVYLSESLEKPLVGLTTDQLESILNRQVNATITSQFIEWLRSCDEMKFKNINVEEDEVVNMKVRLEGLISEFEAYFIEENRRAMKDAV